MNIKHTSFVFLLAFTMSVSHAGDIAGGKDHPLISRFSGAQLDGFQEIEFESGVFYLPDPTAPSKELLRDQPVTVEGKVTRLLYLGPKGKTPLEVHRNYEQALKSAGATLKATVNGRDAWWAPDQHWRANFAELKFQNGWATDITPFWRDGLYLYGVVHRGSNAFHVSVLIAQNAQENNAKQAAIALQIVEPVAMATGQVQINASVLQQELKAVGKVALYGIYFDTGKAELKTESTAQLEQMAIMLRQSPALRVFIVGHTDNHGQYNQNLALSQRRADAVVAALVKDFKIDAGRLQAKGAANIAPVASNSAETGRAKNRRVEMVEQ